MNSRISAAIAATLATLSAANAATPSYELIILAPPAASVFSDSHASAIASSGAIGGYVTGPVQAARWDTAGSVTALPDLPDFRDNRGLGINAAGAVVGYGQDFAPEPVTGVTNGFLWRPDGSFSDLNALPQSGSSFAFSFARDINDSGMIVGMSNNSAVYWQDSGAASNTPLPLASNAGMSSAFALNSAGTIVGENAGRAVVWQKAAAGPVPLPGPNGATALTDTSTARAISDNNIIAGYGRITQQSGEGATHAVRWTFDLANPDAITAEELLPPSGYAASFGYGVNTAGLVVGQAISDPMRSAVLWDETGAAFLLEDLIALDSRIIGFTLTTATGINDQGWIVGDGLMSDGSTRGFLLRPVPEPSSLALAAIGAAAVGWWMMRRRA